MDVKLLIDGLIQNGRPLAVALLFFGIVSLLFKTRVAKRLWASIEETIFL